MFQHGRVHLVLRQIIRTPAALRQEIRITICVHPSRSVRTVGEKVDIDDLVDAVEIARRIGVARPQVIHDWRRRHEDFPKPVARFGNAHVWLWQDVERWALSTGRLGRDHRPSEWTSCETV